MVSPNTRRTKARLQSEGLASKSAWNFQEFIRRHSKRFYLDASPLDRFSVRHFNTDRGARLSFSRLRSWEQRGWLENTLTEFVGDGQQRTHWEVTDSGREVLEAVL